MIKKFFAKMFRNPRTVLVEETFEELLSAAELMVFAHTLEESRRALASLQYAIAKARVLGFKPTRPKV